MIRKSSVRKSYVGQRFGRLLVLERTSLGFKPGTNTNRIAYICLCDCGNKTTVRYENLTNGNTSSCGCLRIETCKAKKMLDNVIRLHEIGRYYRRNAKVRGIFWNIKTKDLEAILIQPCTYCGINDGAFGYIGMDRVDNTKGYEKSNVVACCKRCNQGKNDMTLNEFIEWTNRIYEWRNKNA